MACTPHVVQLLEREPTTMLISIISQSPTFAPAAVALLAIVVAFLISRKWAGSSLRRKALIGGGIVGMALVSYLGFGLSAALVLDRVDDLSWLPDQAFIMMDSYARLTIRVLNLV